MARRLLTQIRRFAFTLPFLAAPAAAWDIQGSPPPADFEAFHARLSAAVYHYPRHGAAPLGLIGFDVYADAAVDQDFDDEPFVATAIEGDMTGGLAVVRVGARKGLPGGFDIGVSYGRVVEGDVELASADLQYAILEGGAVTPAVSLRLTGTRTLEAGAYDLDQYGAELLISKGFAVLTPFAGAGLVHSRGRYDTADGLRLADDTTRSVFYGGVTLNLLIPKITVAVEKADVVQGAVRVAVGF